MDLGAIIGGLGGSALGGGILGGVLRAVPEVMKWLDRKDERKHELAMFDLQMKADAQKTKEQLELLAAQHSFEADTKDLDVLLAGVTAQGGKSGVGWADALNTLVRPTLTLYWCVLLYSFVLWARFHLLLKAHVPAAEAIVQLWGPAEVSIVASMFSFWFLDRSLRKGGGVAVAH